MSLSATYRTDIFAVQDDVTQHVVAASRDFRSGSKGELGRSQRHVRFDLRTGLSVDIAQRPPCANSGIGKSSIPLS